MTMPDERTRALRFAGEVLQEMLTRDDVPADLKQQARVTLRHYPTEQQLHGLRHDPGSGCHSDPRKRLLAAVQSHWDQHPEQRLMQLLLNRINPGEPCPQVFYCEDAKLRSLLSMDRCQPPSSAVKS